MESTRNLNALKHGSIKNEIVDKDKASLTKIKNLHGAGQIMSHRLENYTQLG